MNQPDHIHCEITPGATANVDRGVSVETLGALAAMVRAVKDRPGTLRTGDRFSGGGKTLVACRDCWQCFGAVEVEPRAWTEYCPHCGAFDPHSSLPENAEISHDRERRKDP